MAATVSSPALSQFVRKIAVYLNAISQSPNLLGQGERVVIDASHSSRVCWHGYGGSVACALVRIAPQSLIVA
jgi:hypothetical protein